VSFYEDDKWPVLHPQMLMIFFAPNVVSLHTIVTTTFRFVAKFWPKYGWFAEGMANLVWYNGLLHVVLALNHDCSTRQQTQRLLCFKII
jgi:hypothetical protein